MLAAKASAVWSLEDGVFSGRYYHLGQNDYRRDVVHIYLCLEATKTVTTDSAGIHHRRKKSAPHACLSRPPTQLHHSQMRYSLRGDFCTITDSVLFCGTAIDVRSYFFHAHDTLLTARGQQTFFFLRWSHMLLALCFFCAVLRMSTW